MTAATMTGEVVLTVVGLTAAMMAGCGIANRRYRHHQMYPVAITNSQIAWRTSLSLCFR